MNGWVLLLSVCEDKVLKHGSRCSRVEDFSGSLRINGIIPNPGWSRWNHIIRAEQHLNPHPAALSQQCYQKNLSLLSAGFVKMQHMGHWFIFMWISNINQPFETSLTNSEASARINKPALAAVCARAEPEKHLNTAATNTRNKYFNLLNIYLLSSYHNKSAFAQVEVMIVVRSEESAKETQCGYLLSNVTINRK